MPVLPDDGDIEARELILAEPPFLRQTHRGAQLKDRRRGRPNHPGHAVRVCQFPVAPHELIETAGKMRLPYGCRRIRRRRVAGPRERTSGRGIKTFSSAHHRLCPRRRSDELALANALPTARRPFCCRSPPSGYKPQRRPSVRRPASPPSPDASTCPCRSWTRLRPSPPCAVPEASWKIGRA